MTVWYILQVTSGASHSEVVSQVLMDVTVRLCDGETLEGVLHPATALPQSPDLSSSPTGITKMWYSSSKF